MSSFYYLISSLPSLSLSLTKLPIEEEVLLARLEVGLSEKQFNLVKASRFGQVGQNSGVKDALLKNVHAFERSLGNALVQHSAQLLGLNADSYIRKGELLYLGSDLAKEVLSKGNPLERELALAKARWSFLESHRQTSGFSFKDVQLYYLRWQILRDFMLLNETAGSEKYSNHYQALFAQLGE